MLRLHVSEGLGHYSLLSFEFCGAQCLSTAYLLQPIFVNFYMQHVSHSQLLTFLTRTDKFLSSNFRIGTKYLFDFKTQGFMECTYSNTMCWCT